MWMNIISEFKYAGWKFTLSFIIFLILIIFLVWLLVNLAAMPQTKVSLLWGLVEYTKAEEESNGIIRASRISGVLNAELVFPPGIVHFKKIKTISLNTIFHIYRLSPRT